MSSSLVGIGGYIRLTFSRGGDVGPRVGWRQQIHIALRKVRGFWPSCDVDEGFIGPVKSDIYRVGANMRLSSPETRGLPGAVGIKPLGLSAVLVVHSFVYCYM
jgi:hypothetical protein